MKPEDQKTQKTTNFEKVTIIFGVQVCVTNLYNRKRHKENLGLATTSINVLKRYSDINLTKI